MKLVFREAIESELQEALLILKNAALHLQSKNINQWAYWLNPSYEKIQWIKDGFSQNEFYFIVLGEEVIGMFRLSDEDLLYWGEETEKAKYIHSLVIKSDYSGKGFGKDVMAILGKNALKNGISRLRLDCNAGNKALCSYYESQDFKKVREKQMPESLNFLYEKKLH